MNGKYDDYCMEFSNKELKEHLVKYLIDNSWDEGPIRCLSKDEEEVDINSSEEIRTIVFDGEKEDIFIKLYRAHTSIFVYDLEIMFIDEWGKGTYTSSDVYGNAVYEGRLRELSHEEMLRMFAEILLCFIDSTGVSMTQSDAPENRYKKYRHYTPSMFKIKVQNNHIFKKTRVYENITIRY